MPTPPPLANDLYGRLLIFVGPWLLLLAPPAEYVCTCTELAFVRMQNNIVTCNNSNFSGNIFVKFRLYCLLCPQRTNSHDLCVRSAISRAPLLLVPAVFPLPPLLLLLLSTTCPARNVCGRAKERTGRVTLPSHSGFLRASVFGHDDASASLYSFAQFCCRQLREVARTNSSPWHGLDNLLC